MVNLSIYLGRRGAGKSTLAAQDAKHAAAEDIMVLVHDPLGGFPPSDKWIYASSLGGVKASAESGSVVVARGVGLSELIEWLRSVSLKMPNGSLLVIDEGALLTTVEHTDHMRKKVREIAATARHHKMRLAIIAQNSMLIDHSLISVADRVATFGVVGGYERVKMEMSGIPREIIDKLPTLPDYQYFRGTPGRFASEWNHHSTAPAL